MRVKRVDEDGSPASDGDTVCRGGDGDFEAEGREVGKREGVWQGELGDEDMVERRVISREGEGSADARVVDCFKQVGTCARVVGIGVIAGDHEL